MDDERVYALLDPSLSSDLPWPVSSLDDSYSSSSGIVDTRLFVTGLLLTCFLLSVERL